MPAIHPLLYLVGLAGSVGLGLPGAALVGAVVSRVQPDWLGAQVRGEGGEVELAGGQVIRVQHHPTPDGGRVGLHADVTAALSPQQLEELEGARPGGEAMLGRGGN